MLAVERQPDPVAIDDVSERERVQIRAVNYECRLLIAVLERSSCVDRMRDCHAGAAPGSEHSCQLADGTWHVIDVVQAHICDDQVECIVGEGQYGGICENGRR